MTYLLLILLLSVLVLVLGLVVSADGRGTRPGPRSHPEDPFQIHRPR